MKKAYISTDTDTDPINGGSLINVAVDGNGMI